MSKRPNKDSNLDLSDCKAQDTPECFKAVGLSAHMHAKYSIFSAIHRNHVMSEDQDLIKNMETKKCKIIQLKSCSLLVRSKIQVFWFLIPSLLFFIKLPLLLSWKWIFSAKTVEPATTGFQSQSQLTWKPSLQISESPSWMESCVCLGIKYCFSLSFYFHILPFDYCRRQVPAVGGQAQAEDNEVYWSLRRKSCI